MEKDNFKSYVAVMVAIVTVLGATTACLASVAVSTAGDMDFAGLDSSIRAQKADIINYVTAYEHYRAFTTYTRYDELGYLLYDENATEEVAEIYNEEQAEVWGMASGITALFFSPRYINSEGQYELERELQEEWAKDAQNEDLNATPYFVKSDAERKKSAFLSANMIVFAVSFWFLTIAQVTDKKIKYVWAGLGILFGLAGITLIIIGSFMI